MTLPVNFLYLGGDKCGSTWVHHILSQHPDVTLARAKELFYFDRFYHKGADWYAKQFPDKTECLRKGEVCHDYLYSEKALHRIARDMPLDSRFLVTVRAPVDRTVSHYKYLRKIGRTKASITEALSAQPQIVEHSLFGKYVARAQSILGADRVHVLPFELLKTDPTAFGHAVSDALGIRFLPDLPYADHMLEAQSARNPAIVRILRNVGWAVRAVGAPQIVSRVKSNPLVSRALFAANAPAPSADLTDHCRAELNMRFEQDRHLLDACVPDLWRAPS